MSRRGSDLKARPSKGVHPVRNPSRCDSSTSFRALSAVQGVGTEEDIISNGVHSACSKTTVSGR